MHHFGNQIKYSFAFNEKNLVYLSIENSKARSEFKMDIDGASLDLASNRVNSTSNSEETTTADFSGLGYIGRSNIGDYTLYFDLSSDLGYQHRSQGSNSSVTNLTGSTNQTTNSTNSTDTKRVDRNVVSVLEFY